MSLFGINITRKWFSLLLLLFILVGLFTPAIPSLQAEEGGFWSTAFCAAGEGTVASCTVEAIVGTILGWIVEAFGLLLRLAALIFGYVLQFTVLEFSTWGNNAGITAGWATFRDAGNIFFIFILLYAAIGTILNLHNVDAKKMVVRVIIVAILVNFSGVFTKVLIDSSNSIATYYYESATLTYCNKGDKPEVCTIGDSVMNILKLVRLTSLGDTTASLVGEAIKPENGAGDPGGSSPFITMVVGQFLAIIFTLLTAFVLLAASLFFAARAVVFLFLIVTAPAAYIGWMLPGKGEEIKSMWWGKLTKELIFAPVFFILFSITLKVGLNAGGALSGKSIFEILIYFMILIGLMFGCLMIASSLGAYGAGAAQKIGAGLVIGAGALVGRNTLGRGAAKLANTEIMRKYASSRVGQALGGRYALKGLDKLSEAKFGGTTKGYVGQVKDRAEDAAHFAERLDKNTITGGKAMKVTGQRAKTEKVEETTMVDETYQELNPLTGRMETLTRKVPKTRMVDKAVLNPDGTAVMEDIKEDMHYGQEFINNIQKPVTILPSFSNDTRAGRIGNVVRNVVAGVATGGVHTAAYVGVNEESAVATRAAEAYKKHHDAEGSKAKARANLEEQIRRTQALVDKKTLGELEQLKLENELANLQSRLEDMNTLATIQGNTKKDDHAPKPSGGGGGGGGGGGSAPKPAADH